MTLTVVSGHHAERGICPPSVSTTHTRTPWMWMGWLVMFTLARRIRTRSPRRATSGSVPGKARLLKVKRLKSSMMFGFGVIVPGSTNHMWGKMQKSRSTRGRSG